ncbi:MAG: hypothetical protein HFG27_10950 [Provencibacterium sp.]|jgi:hypothetical protein|nr:hypothetical protein [Provencibacterium sp.]
MKKPIFPLTALLLAAALFVFSPAAAAADRPLMEKDQSLYSREADDFLNIESIRDGGSWRLFEPLYADSGSFCLQVQTAYGSGSLHAEVLEGSLSAQVSRLRPENQPARVKYTYYLLTLTPDAERETDAAEDFSIQLCCGEKKITLEGTIEKNEVFPLFEGLRYRTGSGPLFRVDERLSEEGAEITCAPGLTLFFLGDYDDDIFDLTLDTSLPPEVPALLGEGEFTCYRFTEQPVFEDKVTVQLQAAEKALIYELRNGRLYRVATTYEEGCHRFKTRALTAYICQNA